MLETLPIANFLNLSPTFTSSMKLPNQPYPDLLLMARFCIGLLLFLAGAIGSRQAALNAGCNHDNAASPALDSLEIDVNTANGHGHRIVGAERQRMSCMRPA